MLPRSVAVMIALGLTVGELLNIVGQVFLSTGDTAFHVAYPAVMAALGLTAKRAPDEDPPGDDAPVTAVAEPTPIEPRARHRYREGS